VKPRPLVLSALLLALAAPGGWGLCAQPSTAPKKARAKTAKVQPARPQAEESKLSPDELLHPYAGGNATRWGFDPEPQGRPFGKAQEDPAVSLQIGRESVTDPITQKELAPKADPQKLRENLKNLKFKDALDQTGAKAGVQVDILKF
jgi:hypothetical protein